MRQNKTNRAIAKLVFPRKYVISKHTIYFPFSQACVLNNTLCVLLYQYNSIQGCAKWGFDTPNHNPNPINMWKTTPNPNHNTNFTPILPQFVGEIGVKLGLFDPNFGKLTPTTQHQPNFGAKMTRNWGYPQLGPNFLHIPDLDWITILYFFSKADRLINWLYGLGPFGLLFWFWVFEFCNLFLKTDFVF